MYLSKVDVSTIGLWVLRKLRIHKCQILWIWELSVLRIDIYYQREATLQIFPIASLLFYPQTLWIQKISLCKVSEFMFKKGKFKYTNLTLEWLQLRKLDTVFYKKLV